MRVNEGSGWRSEDVLHSFEGDRILEMGGDETRGQGSEFTPIPDARRIDEKGDMNMEAGEDNRAGSVLGEVLNIRTRGDSLYLSRTGSKEITTL